MQDTKRQFLGSSLSLAQGGVSPIQSHHFARPPSFEQHHAELAAAAANVEHAAEVLPGREGKY